MKRLLLTLLLIGAFLTPVILTETGCTTTAQRVAYNTLFGLETSVTTAYDAYLDLVVHGKVSQAGVPRVSALYNEFQMGLNAALSAANFNWQTVATPDLTAKANAVTAAISAAKGGSI